MNLTLYLIFLVFGTGYIVTKTVFGYYSYCYIIKAVPVISLTLLAFLNVPEIQGKILCLALILSAVGDIFLGQKEIYFTQGLCAFLLAHIAYIYVFAKNPSLQTSSTIVSILLIGYGIAIALYLYPKLGELKIPVLLYITVIISMGITAVLGEFGSIFVVAGACVFICSDSLIAVNKFARKIPYSHMWVMITYYSAQFLMVFGLLKFYKS